MVGSAEKNKFETICSPAYKMKNILFIIISSHNSAGTGIRYIATKNI